MKQVISVKRIGGQLHHRFYEDGELRLEKVNYMPAVFEYPQTDIETEYKDIHGNSLVEKRVKNLFQYEKDWGNVFGNDYAGDVSETIQFISENYDEIEFTNTDEFPLVHFDIEVGPTEQSYSSYQPSEDSDDYNKFPYAEEFLFPVQSIACVKTDTKEIFVFGSKDLSAEMSEKIKQRYNEYSFEYMQFDREKNLLTKFWQMMYYKAGMLNGWNSDFFDVLYLVNRSEFLGIDVKSMLPIPHIKESFSQTDGKSFKLLSGYIQFDAQRLYKKFSENEESYALNDIAQKHIGEKKEDYKDAKSLIEFYKNDYDNFILYNIQDTVLLDKLEKKLGHIKLAMTITNLAKNEPSVIYGTLNIWESLIYNRLKAKKVIVPRKPTITEKKSFAGGYVEIKHPGKFDWVMVYDYASLYPNIKISMNMSSLSYVDPYSLPPDLQDIARKFNIDKFVENPDYMDFSALKKHNVSMGANGHFFRKDKQDPICAIVEDTYKERKANQKIMRKLETAENDGETIEKNELFQIKGMVQNKIPLYKKNNPTSSDYFNIIKNQKIKKYKLKIGTETISVNDNTILYVYRQNQSKPIYVKDLKKTDKLLTEDEVKKL